MTYTNSMSFPNVHQKIFPNVHRQLQLLYYNFKMSSLYTRIGIQIVHSPLNSTDK